MNVPTDVSPDTLTTLQRATTPLVDTLGIEVIETDPRVRLRLPNEVAGRNHVGGPHAGAIFTLGETAAASLMLVRLGHLLDRVVPLAVAAEIHWSKLARCAVIGEARMDADPTELEAQFEAGERPQWPTVITFTREDDGAPCAEMTVTLTLVALRA